MPYDRSNGRAFIDVNPDKEIAWAGAAGISVVHTLDWHVAHTTRCGVSIPRTAKPLPKGRGRCRRCESIVNP